MGTAKYDLSQVKRVPQVALQQLPHIDVIPAYLMATHHPAAVPAAWGAKDGDIKDLVSLTDIGDVPDPCSLEDRVLQWAVGDQGFGRKPYRHLVAPDCQPSRETCLQPIGESARSDLLLQNVLLRINWVPSRQISPSEKFPAGPIANHSRFGLCQKMLYVVSDN